MATIERLYEDLDPITIDLSSLLTAANKVYTDVSGLRFVLKKSKHEQDVDSVFNKTMPDITIDNQAIVTIPFVEADYGSGKLEKCKKYIIGFGLRFTGDTKDREIPLEGSAAGSGTFIELEILEDIIRA